MSPDVGGVREAFAALIAERVRVEGADQSAAFEELEREYELKLWRRWRAAHGIKRKFDRARAEREAATAKPQPGWVGEYHQARFALLQGRTAELTRIYTELRSLAPSVPLDPPADGTETLWHNWFPAEFEAADEPDRYARVRAELEVFVLEPLGVTAGVRMAAAEKGAGDHWNSWEVWVALDDVQVEALKLRDRPRTDPELVRFCWDQGVNPRAYWYLPEDYEQRNGIPRPAHVGK